MPGADILWFLTISVVVYIFFFGSFQAKAPDNSEQKEDYLDEDEDDEDEEPFFRNDLIIYDPHTTDGVAVNEYPFKRGEVVVYLGDVNQMPGHCIVVSSDGKTHFGYHTDDFRSPNEDEV